MQTSEQTPYELPESLGKNLGIQLVSIEEGYVKATMPVDNVPHARVNRKIF